jgi:hypothetical protein
MLSVELVQSALIVLALIPVFSVMQHRLGFTATLIAIGLVSALKFGYDMPDIYANSDYYQRLEVGRHSTPMEVRAAYKRVSLKLHPDKNPAKDAEAIFANVKAAYDVLMDEKSRDAFNRFGKAGVTSDPRIDELKLIAEMGAKYIFWGLATFVGTTSAGAKLCRVWLFIFLLVMLAVEVSFGLTESVLPAWAPEALTEYQVITSLHALFPCVLLSLRALGEHLYVDVDGTTREVVAELITHQQALAALVQQIEAMTAAPDDRDKDYTDVFAELRSVMVLSDDRAQKVTETLKKSSPSPGSNYYWLIFIVIYGGVYLFQGE